MRTRGATGADPTKPDVRAPQLSERERRTTPLGIMRRLIGERKALFAFNLGLRLFKDLLPFVGPLLLGILADVLTGRDRALFGYEFTALDPSSVLTLAAMMSILAVVKMIVGYIHTMVAAHMGSHVVEAARRDLANASMQMALDERRRFNTGDLLDRCLADSKGLRGFTQDVIIRVVSNTARAVWPLLYMFVVDWVMALIVLAVIPLQSTFSVLLQRRLQRQTRVARAAEASHTGAVKEAIDGWSSVASVGGQDWVTGELATTASRSENAKIAKKQTTALISAVISVATAIGIAACYAVGGLRIIDHATVAAAGDAADGVLTFGELTTFIGYARKTYAPFRAYTKIVNNYRTGLVNLERIAEVLDAPMIDPRPNGPELVVTSGDVTLDNVGFTYQGDEDPTLVSLTGRIPGRTLTVITGSSGTGKTTLLRLLMGHDQPSHGTIAIDGQDINTARLSSVQRVMALVPQEPMLFTGTLGDNLTLGLSDATTNDLLDACHRAGLLELVRELPHGLDTEVGSGRHMLSGGQLRRMAIARALLRNPAILMLDEPTAGLDDLHSKQVLDTLRRIAQSATVLMVSHRKDPLMASDHHLILENGSWTDGDGQGDRWRPEFSGSLTEESPGPTRPTDQRTAQPAATAAAAAAKGAGPSPADGNGALDSSACSTVGSAGPNPQTDQNAPSHLAGPNRQTDQNGQADQTDQNRQTDQTDQNRPADQNGQTDDAAASARNGSSPSGSDARVLVGQQQLDLSAMGRPISMTYLDRAAPNGRVLVVGGHRSGATVSPSVIDSVLHAAATDSASALALAAIADLNPDAAFTTNGRTVLGVDIAADHVHTGARETVVFHNALMSWQPDLVIDVGERASTSRPDADVEISIRFDPELGSPPERLAHLGSDIRRRLAAATFSVNVSLDPGETTGLAARSGIAVVEITAVSPPHIADTHRSRQILIQTALATCQSASLIGQVAAPV